MVLIMCLERIEMSSYAKVDRYQIIILENPTIDHLLWFLLSQANTSIKLDYITILVNLMIDQ